MQYQNKNVNEKGRHKIIKIISLCLKNYNLKYYYNGRCFFLYSDGTWSGDRQFPDKHIDYHFWGNYVRLILCCIFLQLPVVQETVFFGLDFGETGISRFVTCYYHTARYPNKGDINMRCYRLKRIITLL